MGSEPVVEIRSSELARIVGRLEGAADTVRYADTDKLEDFLRDTAGDLRQYLDAALDTGEEG